MTAGEVHSRARLDPAERIDRSRARAWALQIHYRWEAGGCEGTLRDALVDTTATRRIAPSRLPLIRALMDLLDQNVDEIDRTLRRYLDNWSLDRLSRVDRAVLRLGAAELLYCEDIPPNVSINEAVELAKRFGTADSKAFVNGIVDRVGRSLGRIDGKRRRR